MELEEWQRHHCKLCRAYRCTNSHGFVGRSALRLKTDNVGRVRFRDITPVQEHKLTIQECPVRLTIERSSQPEGLGFIARLRLALGQDSIISRALEELEYD